MKAYYRKMEAGTRLRHREKPHGPIWTMTGKTVYETRYGHRWEGADDLQPYTDTVWDIEGENNYIPDENLDLFERIDA